VASITNRGYWSTHDRSMQANFTLKERLDVILPGFYLSQSASFSNWTRGSYNVTKNYSRWMKELDDQGEYTYVQTTATLDSYYSINDDRGTNTWDWKQFQAGAGYDRTFEKHSVSAAVNYLQHAYRRDVNQNGNAGVQMFYNTQHIGGRIHYEYDYKYSGEFGFSYSGSDNFAKGNRFGFYPAVSAAWILSKESFLENNDIVDFLKMRLSVGKTGYDPFKWGWSRRYLYQQYYISLGNYPVGNTAPNRQSGLGMEYFANPDIFAEASMICNIGIDAVLFKGFSMNVEAFLDKRSGIVTDDNTLPFLIGIDPPMRNIGKVTTAGIETDLNYRGNINDFRYCIGGNLTWIKDKIDFMGELPPASPLAALTGNSIGSMFGYDCIGFFDLNDFDQNGNLIGAPVPQFGKVQQGDLRYRNIYDNDNVINDRDMLKIGKGDFPDMYFSFRVEAAYSGFDFRALFQGVAGRDVNLLAGGARNKIIAFENNSNAYPVARGRWAYYPDEGIGIDTRQTATYPRLSTLVNQNNYMNSTFWIKSGNFLRLRNVELGYTLPKHVVEKLYLSSGRVFISGVNLLTFSKLMKDYDLDPETLGGYPALKSYNAGITISF